MTTGGSMGTANLIFNPSSGSFSVAKASAIEDLLRGAGINFKSYYPAGVKESAGIVNAITASGDHQLIIPVGGDGTVNTLLNGILNRSTIIGYIPLGTVNVLARELGISSISDAVHRIKNGVVRSFTAGKITSGPFLRYFLLMAGIGFDAAVVKAVRPKEKSLFGKGAYMLSAMRELIEWDHGELEIKVDGKSFRCHSAIICNSSYYGGGVRIAPESDIFSEQFAILACRHCGRKDFVAWGVSHLLGTVPGKSQNNIYLKGSVIEISGDKGVHVDGDYVMQAPLAISTVADFARIIV